MSVEKLSLARIMRMTAIPPTLVRMMAYLVCISIFGVGLITEHFDRQHWWILPCGFLYPLLSGIFSEQYRNRYPEDTAAALLLTDAFFYGSMFPAMSFSLAPCLFIFLMATVTLITYAGARGWAASIAMVILGVFTGSVAFGMPNSVVPSDQIVLIVSAVGVCTFVSLLAYFHHKEASQLISARNQVKLQQEKAAQLSRKLAKYLPPQVWGSIFSGQRDAKLETQRKKLTVFFSDLKGFTEISEELQPEALTDLLNKYFNEMAQIAMKHGGTIDKFIGDAIMIFFGDSGSKDPKQDAIACVSMAIEMRRHVKFMQSMVNDMGLSKQVQARMGINSGYCTVGNFGSESRMDYTIIGKEVNLASRLENVAEPNGIVLSESTYLLV
ncbi:MAG TPA: adenylate/guanylate cyclase domain-containing protein, partial [Pseudomonadales bacterium]|nr:adenylate/guanylate cyclase domain-containing protein [Pseudomonadales bacterium]